MLIFLSNVVKSLAHAILWFYKNLNNQNLLNMVLDIFCSFIFPLFLDVARGVTWGQGGRDSPGIKSL